MLKALALLTALAALTACSGGGDAEPTRAAATTTGPAQLDGTQDYGDLAEVRDDLAERGVQCDRLEEDANPLRAVKQGRCWVGGQEVVIQLWGSAVARGDGTSEVITVFIQADMPYCYVLGKSGGAWSVNAGGQPATCGQIEEALGGERFDENT
jgi:hypothetical protein